MKNKIQNHMFDVAFTLETSMEWRQVTNGEVITALAKRLDALREEYKYSRDRAHGEAFGHVDSYVVLDKKKTK